jgi:hypothetical protein
MNCVNTFKRLGYSKRFLLTSCLLAIVYTAFSQTYGGNDNYAPPSPTAVGFIMQNNTSVDLYTGTVNVNLPIMEIPGRRLKVPIALNYATGGIKVQEVPGWVGSGWNIQAGGMITRIVRGLPDENADGFCGTNDVGEKASAAIDADYLDKVVDRVWDSEPDLFYFNFPGHAGKFVLDAQGNPTLAKFVNVDIIPGICQSTGDGSWTIYDESGTKYVFGKATSARETSNMKAGSIDMNYVSTWYLSEISDPSGEDLITFSYTTGSSVTYEYYIQENSINVYTMSPWVTGDGCTGGDPAGTTTDKNLKITISQPRYLAKITSAKVEVNFSSAAGRADLTNAYNLDAMIVNANGANQYIIKFKYSYFQSDNCTDQLCKRLRLDEVQKVGLQNSAERLYAFVYNTSINLPARNSHAIDHWGYYNSNTYTSKIPAITDPNSFCGGSHSGADRNADTLRSRANILTDVINGAGGYIHYEYSAHEYRSGSANLVAGGARIRSIKTCTSSSCKVSNYSYLSPGSVSTGTLSAVPGYFFRSGTSQFQVVSFTPPSGFYVTKDFLIRTSNSLVDLFEVNGYHLTYSSVREYSPGQGFTIHSFTNSTDHPDGTLNQSTWWSDGSNANVGTALTYQQYPYTPFTSKAFERGLIDQKEEFDQEGKRVLLEDTEYTFSLAAYKTIKARKIGIRSICSPCLGVESTYSIQYIVGEYDIISRPIVLKKRTLTVYDPKDPGNEAKKAVQTTDFSFVPLHLTGTTIAPDLLPRKITTTGADGNKHIVKNKYPNDFTPSTPANMSPIPIKLMQNKHMDDALIESTTSFIASGTTQEYTINGNLYVFDATYLPPAGSTPNDIFLESKHVLRTGNGLTDFVFSKLGTDGRTFIPDTRYKKVQELNAKDSYGNATLVTDGEGITTNYNWTTNGLYLDNSVTNAGTYEHKTSYQHKPLAGITKKTDPNLRESNYEYNSFQQLKVSKDTEGNIVKASTVHSRARVLDLNLTVTGSLLAGSTLTFKAAYADEATTGTTYSWNFGNGATATTSTGSTTYAFPSSGTYKVEVSRNSPMYGISKAIKSITVLSVPQVSICASGPMRGDLCRVVLTADLYGSCPDGTVNWNSPTTFKASASGGCGTYTYQWESAPSSSPTAWSSFGTGGASQSSPYNTWSGVASFVFRCRITDSCGNVAYSNTLFVEFFRSNSTCAQP